MASKMILNCLLAVSAHVTDPTKMIQSRDVVLSQDKS